MTPGEIMNKIQACQHALTAGNTQLKTIGIKKANAERTYRTALAKKILQLREVEKKPVNLIADLARGDDAVSMLRLQRDLEETNYNVCLEAMRNLRLELEAYRSFLTWERVEFKNS